MFKELARLDAGRRHVVRVPTQNNDNRSDRRLAAVSARPARLTCHWTAAAADGKLECHWQMEPGDEAAAEVPGPSFMTGQKLATRRRLARQPVPPTRHALRRALADGRTT